MHVVNLFALRSTSPEALYSHPSPVGPDNDHFIDAGCLSAGRTIIAWGTHGKTYGRSAEVLKRLTGRVEALAFNRDGSPKHPLYARYDTVPLLVQAPTIPGVSV